MQKQSYFEKISGERKFVFFYITFIGLLFTVSSAIFLVKSFSLFGLIAFFIGFVTVLFMILNKHCNNVGSETVILLLLSVIIFRSQSLKTVSFDFDMLKPVGLNISQVVFVIGIALMVCSVAAIKVFDIFYAKNRLNSILIIPYFFVNLLLMNKGVYTVVFTILLYLADSFNENRMSNKPDTITYITYSVLSFLTAFLTVSVLTFCPELSFEHNQSFYLSKLLSWDKTAIIISVIIMFVVYYYIFGVRFEKKKSGSDTVKSNICGFRITVLNAVTVCLLLIFVNITCYNNYIASAVSVIFLQFLQDFILSIYTDENSQTPTELFYKKLKALLLSFFLISFLSVLLYKGQYLISGIILAGAVIIAVIQYVIPKKVRSMGRWALIMLLIFIVVTIFDIWCGMPSDRLVFIVGFLGIGAVMMAMLNYRSEYSIRNYSEIKYLMLAAFAIVAVIPALNIGHSVDINVQSDSAEYGNYYNEGDSVSICVSSAEGTEINELLYAWTDSLTLQDSDEVFKADSNNLTLEIEKYHLIVWIEDSDGCSSREDYFFYDSEKNNFLNELKVYEQFSKFFGFSYVRTK